MRAIVTLVFLLQRHLLAFLLLSLTFLPDATAKSSSSKNSNIEDFSTILPSVDGASITRFLVTSSVAPSSSRPLFTYYSSNLINEDPAQTAKIQRAVIAVHGVDKDADNIFAAARDGLQAASQRDSAVNNESVALLAPIFGVPTAGGVSASDSEGFKNWASGINLADSVATDPLLWSKDDWASGSMNTDFPGNGFVSSFDALDQMVQYFADQSVFPNLKQIVVSGHSAGAQTVQRYAAVGKDLMLSTPISYWIGNPGSFVWFNDQRPLSTKDCGSFNEWRNGLDKFGEDYASDIVSQGPQAVLARWQTKHISLSRGLADFGDLSSDCGPSTTGADRGERFANFLQAFPPPDHHTIDLNTDIGHDAMAMYSSPAGISRVFFDNFSGNGTVAPDFVDDDQSEASGTAASSSASPSSTSSPKLKKALAQLRKSASKKASRRSDVLPSQRRSVQADTGSKRSSTRRWGRRRGRSQTAL